MSQLEWKPWVFIIHGQLESDWILSFYSKTTMWVSPWNRSTSCYSFDPSCLTLWDPMDCSMPGFPVLHHLPELAQTHVHWVMMPSNHLILCRPLLLLPSVSPSIRVFSNESVLRIRWPKYWSFSFSISPCNEYSGLIFFRIDWFHLLVVQGTLKLLKHAVSNTSFLKTIIMVWSYAF